MNGISDYQSMKLVLGDVFGLSRDGFHIIIAFLVFLAAARMFRIRLTGWHALIAPVVLALGLEAKDLYDSVSYGFSIYPLGNLHDVLTSVFLPLLTVLYARLWEHRPD
ncbi:MAG TPA: hypothetical protein VD862_03690 [Candidatus Paceibacterota bacterium]|nr:hypothetical protein [Candidatus Paceibacterota bacterium]